MPSVEDKPQRLERGAGGQPGAAGPPSEGERGRGPASDKKNVRLGPTRAETIAATAMSLPAAAIVSAYLVYRSGRTVHPFLILPLAIAVSVAAFLRLRRFDGSRHDVIAFVAIVCAIFAWLLWLARPTLLWVGGGPDITHHLVLIDYIDRHWQLSRDVVSDPYLGDMVYYTPGSHLLIALVGAWTRTDGLHALYPLVALTVALKAGFVFLIALRLLPEDVPRTPLAVGAVLLLFLPRAYFLGSFTEHSFIAQVVAELFAVVMLWALVVWEETHWIGAMALFAFAGMATFLAWPIWIGPPLVALASVVLFDRRFDHFAVAVTPIAFIAAVHIVGRAQWLAYAATSGYVLRPSIAAIGWTFLLFSAGGLTLVFAKRTSRSVIAFLAAIAVQAIALFVLARRRGADTPYLALKMTYLAIYPLAVCGAVALAALCQQWLYQQWRPASAGLLRRRRIYPPKGGRHWFVRRFVWIAVAFFAALAATRTPPRAPVITKAALEAGIWAREHAPPACVDYLVANGYTAYWLHLAVLRNPRPTVRMEDPDTFEPQKALIRWIYPSGLPYAITDDFDALPRDIRTSVDVAARFGRAAVVRRRGSPICDTGSR
jgi:hypothetical protein